MIPGAGLLLALAVASAPLRFADLQKSLAREAPDGDARVRRFIDRAGGTPIIEGTTAFFLVEGEPAAPPRIVGDFNRWGEGEAGVKSSRLERLGSTRFFFLRVELQPAARVEYLVVVGGSEALDPRNPRHVENFSGAQSEVRMPGYVPVVDLSERPAAPRGTVVSFEHRSEILGNSRRVHVYVPTGYDPGAPRRYPEAWLGDGTTYVERVGAPLILDRLIARGAIEPLVAIFVDPSDRRIEYSLHPGYRRMIVDELVPRIASDYRVENRAARRLLAGGPRGARWRSTFAWPRRRRSGSAGPGPQPFLRGPWPTFLPNAGRRGTSRCSGRSTTTRTARTLPPFATHSPLSAEGSTTWRPPRDTPWALGRTSWPASC